MTLSRMAEVCNGRYIGRAEDALREVDSITTDSRKAEPGSLFAAIKGERVDGHTFIPSVFEKVSFQSMSWKDRMETIFWWIPLWKL